MRFLAISALFLISMSHPSAQTPVPTVESFEVVSVKPAQPGRMPPGVAALGGCTFNGARLNCPVVTAQQLITRAFLSADGTGLRSSQITNGPGWLSTSQFEVIGVMPRAVERDEMARLLPAAVRKVLELRFKLRSHFERRAVPVYALVKANKEGRLGPQLRQASTDCPSAPQDAPTRPPAVAGNYCYGGSFREGSIQSGAVTMAGLASNITGQNPADPRPVIDRTGLSGKFEVDLRWTPVSANGTARLPDGSQPDLPDLFTAIREQLGLKLEPTTEMMDVLVIDHLETPDPN